MNTKTTRVYPGLSLRANFSWTFVGNVIYSACQWGSLMVLAKLGTPEMVGQFALGLAIATPIMTTSRLGLLGIQATDAKREYRFGDYLGLRLLATILAFLLISSLAFGLDYRLETALVIIAVGLARSFESISDVFYGMFQLHERMDYVSRSQMLKGVLSLIGMGLGILLTGSVFWGVLGMAIAWATLLLVYDLRIGLRLQRVVLADRSFAESQPALAILRPHFHWPSLARLTRLALPLGIVTLLGALNTNIPRYFVEQNMGERELGIFAAIAYLTVVGATIANALARAAQPRLGQYYAACDRRAFSTLLAKLLGLGAALGVAGVLVAAVIGYEVLKILYSPEYAAYSDVLLLVMIAVGINYSMWFLGSAMTAARYLKVQVPLLATVGVVEIIGCFWLIPILGLQGAALALVLAAIVQIILCFLVIAFLLHRFPKPHTTARQVPAGDESVSQAAL